LAIKLKSIQFKNAYKISLILIVLLLLMGVANMGYTILLSREAFFTDDYYETNHFQQNYLRLSHNVVEKYLDLVDEQTIRDKRELSQVDVALARLSTINDNLKRASSFEYVLINTQQSQIITNIEPETWTKKHDSVEAYIKQLTTVVQWDQSGIYFPAVSKMSNQPFINKNYFNTNQFGTTNVSASDVVYRLSSGNWIYYTAVNFDKIYNDLLFGNDYTLYKSAHLKTSNYSFNIALIGIALFVLIVQLCFVLGKESVEDKAKLIFFDYIPLEFQTLLCIGSFLPFFAYLNSNNENLESNNTRLVILSLLLISILVIFVEFMSIVRMIKTNEILKNPVVFRVIRLFTRIFILDYGKTSTKIKVLILAVGMVTVNVVLAIGFRDSSGIQTLFAFIAFVTLNSVVFGWLVLVSDEVSSLVVATHKRAEGIVDFSIDESRYQYAFRGFAKDLNALQNGLQVALEEAIKGEKLKTELITNVSHDLKNPLTSIVSYIDLLNKKIIYTTTKELTEEEKKQQQEEIEMYLNVLSDKSFRLKTLIEDLVSASKASSGNMEVDSQVIDIRQLVQQCIGEKETEMSKQQLEVVLLPQNSQPLLGYVDPNHMYRVFDNLLSNIVKYSMKGTRVYIHLSENDDRIFITFKNISNHALEIDVEELKKRFVRGDRARTSEGSGLGLSIVESLLDLQDGKLDISVDGDLFKAIVCVLKSNQNLYEIN
jgi:signal transduction histidine kinase